jgi:NADH-quinone oxidoreductase subunit M
MPATLTWDAFLLSLSWLIPAFTAVAVALVPSRRSAPGAKSDCHISVDGRDTKCDTSLHAIRRVALAGAGLNLLLVAWLVVRYALGDYGAAHPFAFAAKIPWFASMNIHYLVAADGISLVMMLLAAIVAFCGVLVSWTIEERAKEFFILMNVLLAGVFGCFISFDLFTFFLFNEVTLIPTYLLIGIFGSGRKEYAAMKLNLMLIGGSALILTGILALFYGSGLKSFDLFELAATRIPVGLQHWVFPMIFLGFGVLGALFPFHTWSPDGHSSAPTAISMFLAGVHMKLGGYGCLRIAMYLMPEGAQQWMGLFLVLATINIVYGAFVAVWQQDLKYLNAYASVSHCGLVIFGYAAMNVIGIRGAVLQMFSHGLVTALFFACIGMIYNRTHTRMVGEMGGLMKTMPFIGVAFILAGFAGLGLPGLSGFVAELTVFIGGFANPALLNRTCAVLSVLSIVIAAVYILRATNAVLHGPIRAEHAALPDATLQERAAAVVLLGTSLAMGVYPGWITRLIDGSVEAMAANILR